MAASAGQTGMFAIQFKWRLVMIECLAVSIDAVMAGQAIIAISSGVGLHKSRINGGVTCRACLQVEGIETLGMAVLAGKGLSTA